jgi:hypothetical protein
MYLINKRNNRNEVIPIIHNCNEEDTGRPITTEELHGLAVELIMVYHYKQGAEIKSMNTKSGYEHPHIVMVNNENHTLYYVTIKADYKPNIPKPLPKQYYTSFINRAKKAEAIPVFIGVVFDKIPKNGQSETLCGDGLIVEYTGFLAING